MNQTMKNEKNTINKNQNNNIIMDEIGFDDPAFNDNVLNNNQLNNKYCAKKIYKKLNAKFSTSSNFDPNSQIKDTRISLLVDKLGQAIVTVNAQYTKRELDTTFNTGGSGFFIEYNNNLYIITSAHIVLNTTVVDPMTSIFVGVNNVNQTGLRLLYKAKIIGVDATADVAVLELINEGQIDFPRVGKNIVVKLGNELKTPTTTKIFNISNPLLKNRNSYVEGNIRDNLWFDNSGNYIVSCVVTDLLVYPGSSGSPVFDYNTGLCLGIISFGFTDADKINDIGFGGGCGISTIKIILKNIFNNVSVNLVTANNGTQYLTNLKGFFGYVHWIAANANFISSIYPRNYKNLQLRGIILTKIDPLGPLAHPLNNAKPLALGDIIVSLTLNGVRYVFGGGTNEVPVGLPLWKINPLDNKNNVVELEIIRNPNINSKLERIKVRLNQINNPVYERPNTNNKLLGSVGDALLPINDALNTVETAAYNVNPLLGAIVSNSPVGAVNDIVNVVRDTADFFQNLF